MSLMNNNNDGLTIAYLIKKVKEETSTALTKAVNAINTTIATITTNMPTWIDVNIGYESNESAEDKLARLLSGTYLPREKPFIGRVLTGSRYFIAGQLYESSGKLYGSVVFNGIGSTNGGLYAINQGVAYKQSIRPDDVVKKAGDTMSDTLIIQKNTSIAQNYPSQIKFQPHQTDNNLTYTGAYVATYDDHDAASNGANMVIQSGSNMIIGSGESPGNLYAALYKDSAGENMAICGDGTIEFFTNCQTIANRVNTRIDTSGNFTGKAANVTGTVAIANGGTGATTAANARTNLGAVNKAGDTMTGTLTLNGAGLVEKNLSYAIGDAPGSQTAVSITWTDKNNSQIGFVGAGWEANGNLFQQIGVNRTVSGTTKWHHVRQSIASDGTTTVSFGQVAAWRAGLGLGNTSGAVPIANGGTGQTATGSVTTISSIATAASGVKISSATYEYWGKLAMVEIVMTTTASKSADATLCTLVSGKRPAVTTETTWINHYFYMVSGGAVKTTDALSSGTYLIARFTYLLP